MRRVIGLLALGSIAAVAIYLLAVRDRTFQSYASIEVGMPLGAALKRLQADGYLVVHGPPQVKDRDCTSGDKYAVVYGPDPTYSLTISPDRDCNVREIARRLRGMEL